MDHLFSQFGFTFVYLDDILVASSSHEEHLLHLRQVFSTLQAAGLRINPEKCVFAQPTVEFLGHKVTATGVAPLSKHVEAVQSFPPPSTIQQLQRFLGLLNFYRRFLPGIAKVLKPLTDSLAGNPRHLQWTEHHQQAFEAAKAALAAAVPLSHPAREAVLALYTDASSTHIGGVLQQKVGQVQQPLAFFSRKLSPTEQRYCTFDRELLGAYAAVKHFRFLLEGRRFTLYTDHRPLTSSLHQIDVACPERRQRQLAFLAEFTSDVQHVRGEDNVVADLLSRPPEAVSEPESRKVASVKEPSGSLTTSLSSDGTAGASEGHLVVSTVAGSAPSFSYSELAQLQQSCPDVAALRASAALDVQQVTVGGEKIFCDISLGSPRPLVPLPLQRAVFEQLHNVAHPGVRATRRLISTRFVWSHMATKLGQWTRECVRCQLSKTHQTVNLKAAVMPVPVRRFSHVHIDLVGPLPASGGCTQILTMMDRSTRWPEAVPMREVSARGCAVAFVQHWVSRFGVPDVLTSDRGTQFTSSVWKLVCELLGIHHIQTTAFHPQSNGLLERFHRRLKTALRARSTSSSWADQLPLIMLHLRATPREDLPRAPAEAVYGSQLFLPGQLVGTPEPPDIFFRQLQEAMSGFQPVQARHATSSGEQEPSTLPEELMTAPRVFLKRDGYHGPLQPTWDGPYKVLQRSRHVFRLQVGSREETVSTHRLKPAHVEESQPDGTPRARGRPKKVRFIC